MRPISSFQVPTPEELTALRAVPKHRRDQALIEVLAGCGLRVAEVCALQVAHLHWTGEAPFLRIVDKRVDILLLVPQRVTGQVTATGQHLEGRLVHLSPVVDAQSGRCRAEVLFPGAGKNSSPALWSGSN